MVKKLYTSYNPFFLIPFAIWIVVGGILQVYFPFDQIFTFINLHYNPVADEIMFLMTWLGEGTVVTFILLLLLLLKPLRNWWYVLAAALCNLVPTFVEQIMKRIYSAPRPLKYFDDGAWIHILPSWPRLYGNSFPSGHSSGAFGLFCFLSLLLPRRYRGFGLLFFLLAISVCYSRVYLAAHFFADVYAGSIIGGMVCVLTFMLINVIGNWLSTKILRNK